MTHLQADIDKALVILEKHKENRHNGDCGFFFDEQRIACLADFRNAELDVDEDIAVMVTIIDRTTWYKTPLGLDRVRKIQRGLRDVEKHTPLIPTLRNNGRKGYGEKHDKVRMFGNLEAVEDFVSMSKQNLEQAQEYGNNKLIGAMSKMYEEDCELLKIAENYDFKREARKLEEEKHKAIDYQEALKDGVEVQIRKCGYFDTDNRVTLTYTRNDSQYQYEGRQTSDAIDAAVNMYRMIRDGKTKERIKTITEQIKSLTDLLIPYCYKKQATLQVKYGLSYKQRERGHSIEKSISEYQKELLFLIAQTTKRKKAA